MVVVSGIIFLFTLSGERPEFDEYDEVKITENRGIDNTKLIILNIPVIEYENGNLLSEPIIIDYDQEIIMKNDEFVIDPTKLGYDIGLSIGAMKLRLVDILPDSIIIDVLADIQLDGKFYPRDEIERYDINNSSCVSAFPLVVDVYYEYCFELNKGDSHFSLSYSVREDSTMPSP